LMQLEAEVRPVRNAGLGHVEEFCLDGLVVDTWLLS